MVRAVMRDVTKAVQVHRDNELPRLRRQVAELKVALQQCFTGAHRGTSAPVNWYRDRLAEIDSIVTAGIRD